MMSSTRRTSSLVTIALSSIFKPPLQRSVLFVGEGRVQVFDCDIGRGDQHRLGVRERVKAILAVVMADPSRSGATERHGLDEQVNIDQIYPTTAAGDLTDETIDAFLIAAEDEAGKRAWRRRHPGQRLVEGLVG